MGAKVTNKVTAEERKELLSRNPVNVHNSSVDNSGGSGIIKSGAISGALDYEGEDYEKAKAHAKLNHPYGKSHLNFKRKLSPNMEECTLKKIRKY